MSALCVALLGAESTGKSSLAQSLSQALVHSTGLRVAQVDEVLREWCNAQGRTPTQAEQAGIAEAQRQRIDAARATHDLVICDTTPLMTAVYSELIFGDTTLYANAAAFQRTLQLNLVMALDLPWVADGIQRDGAHVRAPVDRLLRQHLHADGLDFSVVRGLGASRLESALNAITPLLLTHRPAAPAQAGLFQRLLQRESNLPQATRWTCELCDDAACEHAVRQPR